MALIRQCSTAAFQSDTPIANHSHKPSARAGTATMLYHDYHVIVNLHSEQYSELGRVLETDDFVEITWNYGWVMHGYPWLSQVLHGPWFSMLAVRPVLHLGGKKMRRSMQNQFFWCFSVTFFLPLCVSSEDPWSRSGLVVSFWFTFSESMTWHTPKQEIVNASKGFVWIGCFIFLGDNYGVRRRMRGHSPLQCYRMLLYSSITVLYIL